MERKERTYSGVLTPEVSEREIVNRQLVRKAATQGFVLMKNEGLLPIASTTKLFLAGTGATHAIKGGTGSGDVNEREVVSIIDGMVGAGLAVVNEEDVRASIADYDTCIKDYAKEIVEKTAGMSAGSNMDIFGVFATTKMKPFKRVAINANNIKKADVAVYVISRIAGEGKDRFSEAGDYYLSKEEAEELEKLSKYCQNIIVLINAGGQIDLKDVLKNKSVKSILNISQPGMELGNAVCDVLLGKDTPSGKLTSTWAVNYEDYPSSAGFSHNNGNTSKDLYTEGIYVGYRYFDSFKVKTQFPFGFGLSYTSFITTEKTLSVKKDIIQITARVTNAGDSYSGKETLFAFVACPQTDIKKELKRLTAFKKTGEILPGKSETIKLEFDSKTIASFDEDSASWLVEAGDYGVFLGTNAEDVSLVGVINVDSNYLIEEVSHILPLKEELKEIVRKDKVADEFTTSWQAEAEKKGFKPLSYVPYVEEPAPEGRDDLLEHAYEIAEELTDDELIALLMGEITKGQDNVKDNVLVETGIYVPGAAGETTNRLEEKFDVPAISMADGPAGVRVVRNYDVDKKTGKIYGVGLFSCLEGGLFRPDFKNKNVDTYYMYATAIPIGTHLAQTFDVDLVEELGKMVAGEMLEFGVSWWLAPGMNIHRNPLCGRNFEYYSEDPLVAGMMAAAMTNGVQSEPGVGTTIKHFACNNAEDNRMGSNSVVSERALREIYLRGFEIAIKNSQPMCIMTSYNLINGIHTANSYDLCTEVARDEWGFAGAIMTDWTTTTAGGSKAHVCALAGNDLIMPGNQKDVDEIKAALEDGSLPRQMARECAARLINVILQTSGMKDAIPYRNQFL